MPSLTAKTKILNALKTQLRIIQGSSSGVRATARAYVENGVIKEVNMTRGGSNYAANPQVLVNGGGGTGADLRAKVLSGEDSVTSVEIVNGGTGYTTAPIITILPPTAAYNSLVYENVFRDFKFLQEINDFPTICFSTGRLQREHYGGGVVYERFRVNIRGYVMEDNSIEACEDLAEDIERVVNRLRDVKTNTNAQPITESRILSISTDEGLFEPYGIVDVIAEITYDYESFGPDEEGNFILLESGDGFLLTESGDFLILKDSVGQSFLLLEDGVGQLLSEDGAALLQEN
jgi:hypothetical protein